MSVTRGVPVQDLVENQDPDVAYIVNEVTGERSPLVQPVVEEKPRRGRRKAEPAPEPVEEVPDEPAAEGDGE